MVRSADRGFIYPASHTSITYIGMNRVSEIHGCRPSGQFQNFTFRGENVKLILEQINLYVLYKLKRVTGIFLNLH